MVGTIPLSIQLPEMAPMRNRISTAVPMVLMLAPMASLMVAHFTL